jgi:hypothetical protein
MHELQAIATTMSNAADRVIDMDIDSVGASIAGFLYRCSAEKFSRPATFVQMTLFFA